MGAGEKAKMGKKNSSKKIKSISLLEIFFAHLASVVQNHIRHNGLWPFILAVF